MKQLSAYPQPIKNTGIGLHDAEDKYWRPAKLADFIALLKAHGVTWYKLLVGDAGKVDIATALKQAGIEPIVRIMYGDSRPNPGNIWLTHEMAKVAGAYTAQGVSYFELSNEPNLNGEWENNTIPSNGPGLIAEQYIRNAHAIEERGGICLVPALSPGGNWPHAAFYKTFMEEMRVRNGWVGIQWPAFAIHNRPIGHPLDYPEDIINQAEHPGATLEDDSTCFRLYEWLDGLIVHYLGGSVPLLGTEAGYDFGSYDSRYNRESELWYNAIDPERHAHLNGSIYQGFKIGRWAPFLLCQCYWKGFSSRAEGHVDLWREDTLLDNPVFGGDLPLARRLREIADGSDGGSQPPPPNEGGDMPEFAYALQEKAVELGSKVVGEAHEEQVDFRVDGGKTLSFQMTTKGLMVYESGLAHFLPGAVLPL